MLETGMRKTSLKNIQNNRASDPSKSEEIRIVNSCAEDIGLIMQLFDSAISYQEKNNYPLWPRFSEPFILKEISEKRHWKILQGDTIICIFSVMYHDPEIWGEERNLEPSVYLHRIAVNPSFKGRKMMMTIKQWAIAHARKENKKYVRMDTWGNNENLKAYYIGCGFEYLGQQYLKEIEGSPMHYGGSVLSLFQVEV
jgi:predicted GNAT family N-acyltransferase